MTRQNRLDGLMIGPRNARYGEGEGKKKENEDRPTGLTASKVKVNDNPMFSTLQDRVSLVIPQTSTFPYNAVHCKSERYV